MQKSEFESRPPYIIQHLYQWAILNKVSIFITTRLSPFSFDVVAKSFINEISM